MLWPLAACSPLLLLNALIRSDGYDLAADIPYGGHAPQKLDVYVPRDVRPGDSRPVVVFFYGGRWQFGDRADCRFAGEALTSQGFVAVVPDYLGELLIFMKKGGQWPPRKV